MQEIPKDRWTQGFWDAARDGRLALSRCGACGRWRWPPGPFCPACHSQAVDWAPPGIARLYSYTVLQGGSESGRAQTVVGLVEFPDAHGIRIVAAIAGGPSSRIAIGAAVDVRWSSAGEDRVPVFVPCRTEAEASPPAPPDMDVQT